ncbi:DNA G:T-mismatch repair endonuclease [Hahella chejuensis KCTC 2396]|uniref:Very short patch repair endonuclease n=1 Tax=Hahella chejuensis (strain KCTC 2396) TaxID=349521 RepID=Q2SAF1_HAHCH|nr:DNA G:T-mismatch repair endonuclease [Hahella chejuensis KCTC 2396]
MDAKTDVLTPEQRKLCMSKIRGKNTKPELLLRKALWSIGLRYRLQGKITGRPDLIFSGPKVAVFVDGCFWHGCPEHYRTPQNNQAFWKEKLRRNMCRDKAVNRILVDNGWLVVRLWEHEVKSDLECCVSRILAALRKQAG